MSDPNARAFQSYMRGNRMLMLAHLAVTVLLGVMVIQLLPLTGQVNGMTNGYTALREQVELLGGVPVAPPADDLLENPDTPISQPEPIDPLKLREAARAVLTFMLPGQVDSTVDRYVSACSASGDCKGPQGTPGTTGPPGPAGRDPSPGDVAAAVLSVCSAELDCEATPDEVAQAVVDYCGQASEPCGTRWTEEQIYRIANRAVVDYLTGRPIWCPREDEVPNDQPFGPCYVSAG